jgi:hypothetical protein
MESRIKTYTYPNGEIQRVQVLRWNDWSQLDFLSMTPSETALDCFSAIYRNYLVPAAPFLFGTMILFRLPPDLETDFPYTTRRSGTVADPLTAAAAALREGVKIRAGKPVFRDERTRSFWQALEARDCIRLVSGMLPITTVIPLNDFPGTLTETAPDALMKVNASFFIMDRFDCATVYDQVGTPFGLCVRNGVVTHPPLYHREALLINQDGSVCIRPMDVSMLDIEIDGNIYTPGKNAAIYTRPRHPRTPRGKRTALVIIGNRVAAVCRGSVRVPASGFVLCPEGDCSVEPGTPVFYRGLEDIQFGIQVGNSILRNGQKTTRFLSRFYNIRHLEPVPYPPSLYPMNFSRARAARIALGADATGKPMLLWAEGAAKFGYVPGNGSCGASLREMADICADVGMYNAVNLDGGGSAQILLNNRRSLMISDRNASDHTEAERPVPLALYIAGSAQDVQ